MSSPACSPDRSQSPTPPWRRCLSLMPGSSSVPRQCRRLGLQRWPDPNRKAARKPDQILSPRISGRGLRQLCECLLRTSRALLVGVHRLAQRRVASLGRRSAYRTLLPNRLIRGHLAITLAPHQIRRTDRKPVHRRDQLSLVRGYVLHHPHAAAENEQPTAASRGHAVVRNRSSSFRANGCSSVGVFRRSKRINVTALPRAAAGTFENRYCFAPLTPAEAPELPVSSVNAAMRCSRPFSFKTKSFAVSPVTLCPLASCTTTSSDTSRVVTRIAGPAACPGHTAADQTRAAKRVVSKTAGRRICRREDTGLTPPRSNSNMRVISAS